MAKGNGLMLLSGGDNGRYCSSGSCPSGYVLLSSGMVVAVGIQGYRIRDMATLARVPKGVVQETAEAVAGMQIAGKRDREEYRQTGRLLRLSGGDFLALGELAPDAHERGVPDGETLLLMDPQVVQQAAGLGSRKFAMSLGKESVGGLSL